MRALQRLAVALLIAVPLATAGCGQENSLDVVEGEPVQLGELEYNIQLTRFLNPADPEDKAYLAGQPAPKANQLYLAVFMVIDNSGDSSQTLPRDFAVRDTEGNAYKPVESRSIFALDLGGKVPQDGEVPNAESAAANGPIEGAMVLFRVPDQVTESRPLTLDIPSTEGEKAEVELDI